MGAGCRARQAAWRHDGLQKRCRWIGVNPLEPGATSWNPGSQVRPPSLAPAYARRPARCRGQLNHGGDTAEPHTLSTERGALPESSRTPGQLHLSFGTGTSTTRRPERCQHYLAQLRTLAPPTALTADTLAHTPAPAVLRPAHPPGRRLVVRSHSLTGSMSVTFLLWLGVALVPVIASVALLVQHHTATQVIGGLITLTLVAAITIGVHRATVARLIVSRTGLKTRGMPSRLRATLDWTEVADLTVNPVLNDQQSRVGGELAAVTTAGSVKPLYPTQRRLRQAYELRGEILAYRP